MTLDNATLARLAETASRKPPTTAEISVGIVHFGVGGFHRAHQAMYVDRLLEMGRRQGLGHLRRRRACRRTARWQR